MSGALINHLWESTLFTVLVWILAFVLSKNRAHIRYWLWFSASCKFVVPFALLTILGGYLALTPAAQNMARHMADPTVSPTMVQTTQPFSGIVHRMPVKETTRDWLPVLLFAIWLGGVCAITLMRLRDWLRIRVTLRSSTVSDIAAAVPVLYSAGLLEPGVVGVWRPILLLPAGIKQRLTEPQLEAVLAHELCHVRRRDNLLASLHMIVEAAFWFHPAVWWIGARLMEERERACDEEVLRLGSEPRIYAEGIVNVCKLYAESPLACISGVTGSNIKRRIEGIMANQIVLKVNFARKLTLAGAGITVLALPVIIGMVDTSIIRAQPAASAIPRFKETSIRLCGDVPGVDGPAAAPPAGAASASAPPPSRKWARDVPSPPAG